VGHDRLAPTSSLRLSAHGPALCLTACLRPVVGFPTLRLLRRLRPLPSLGRTLAYAVQESWARCPSAPTERRHDAVGSACTPGSALCLARSRGLRVVGGRAAGLSQARISSPFRGRTPVTTSKALRDDVPTCGASVGSCWGSRGITLASSTVECRASTCHSVG